MMATAAAAAAAAGAHNPAISTVMDEFAAQGFVVVPAVLSAAQVAEARSLLASHREAHAERCWTSPPGEPGADSGSMYGPNAESGRWQCNRLFEADTSLDPLLHTLLTAEPLATLVREIVGDDLCLRTVWSMWRMPVHEPPPPPEEREEGSAWPVESGVHYQMWHREEGGILLPQHPLFVHSLQVKVELDDCDSTTHCITTVPESLDEKRCGNRCFLGYFQNHGLARQVRTNVQKVEPNQRLSAVGWRSSQRRVAASERPSCTARTALSR
jgi:hypothetical protein